MSSFAFRRSGLGRVCAQTEPAVRLMRQRCSNLAQRLAELHELGRTPRVCLYARISSAQYPLRALEEAQALAEYKGWAVCAERIFVDRADGGAAAPRAGWLAVQQMVRSGFADGVVTPSAAAISDDAATYEAQLQWFAQHLAFVALATPEVPPMVR